MAPDKVVDGFFRIDRVALALIQRFATAQNFLQHFGRDLGFRASRRALRLVHTVYACTDRARFQRLANWLRSDLRENGTEQSRRWDARINFVSLLAFAGLHQTRIGFVSVLASDASY